MKKIYFWSPVPVHHFEVHDHPYAQLDQKFSALFIANGFSYLNSYLRRNRHDLYCQIEWTNIDFLFRDEKNLLEAICDNDIDLLLVSVYIWNAEQIFSVLKSIRNKIPTKVKIVAGGPSVDPHRDRQYLDHHPYLDYAVYGQGEIAFANILDEIINQQLLSPLVSRNVSWRSKTGIKIADYEFVRDPHCSPILDSEHLFEQIVANKDYKSFRLVLPYETSKGCPYKCTFCDWGSGLTHKVYHRKWHWSDELDFLGRIGITDMHMADANFGMHKQDWEVAETLAKLKREKHYNFQLHTVNFAKLNKTQVMALAGFLYKEGLYLSSKFSLQDTNAEVLENIDRPDVPWKQHKKMIDDLCSQYPTMIPRVEVIQGLPGQTRQTWEQTLLDISEYWNFIFPWYMLPNSPGATLAYREKMKIKTIKSICPMTGSITEIVIETMSYDINDYCYFTLLTNIATNPLLQRSGSDQKKQLFDLVKADVDLDLTIDQIKHSLVDTSQTKPPNFTKNIAGKLIDKVVTVNKSLFSREFIKQWVLQKHTLQAIGVQK